MENIVRDVFQTENNGENKMDSVTAVFEEWYASHAPGGGNQTWDGDSLAEQGDGTVYSSDITAVLALLITVVAFLTLAGNVLVIIAFATEPKLRTFGNYFILNLAFTDLFVAVLIVWYSPYALLGEWIWGRPSCVSFLVLDYAVTMASCWNMAIISVERFCSIACPVAYRLHQGPRLAMMIMTIPWLAGFLFYGPGVLYWEFQPAIDLRPVDQCYAGFYASVSFLLGAVCMEFLIPFSTVALFNFLIYINIRRRSRLLKRSSPKRNGKEQTTSSGSRASLARDRKSARSLAILVTTFGLTWGPYEMCALINPICKFCIPVIVFDVTFWVLWLNSTVNPMLYPFLQTRFRVAFQHILCKVVGRGRQIIYPSASGVATVSMRAPSG